MAASPNHSTPPSRTPSSPTMAAPSSSSCEVVDLAAAAIRDDATSKLFFSKHGGGGGGGGGGELSWPAAARVPSALTNQKSLVALCEKYGVPSELKPVCAATLGCAACETPPPPPPSPTEGQVSSKALCVYSAALEAGLRFPMPVFYQKLLRHYGLAPSQLVPNAWRYIAGFVQRCKDAGVEPSVSAFRYFFSVCAHKRQDIPLGWHHFKPYAGRRLFKGTLYTRFDWKTRFFFLEYPEGMPWKFPVTWGKPRMEDARTVEETDAVIEKLKLLPCVDWKDVLSPPVGALDLLQLHSTPAPMVQPESAAASAAQAFDVTSLQQLHATLEAGARAPSAADAASDGDDMTWGTRRKRRCSGPGPDPASVNVAPPMPQSFAISAMPPPLQGVELAPCETSFDGTCGSSEISMPPGIWESDVLCVYDAMVAIDADNARRQEEQQGTDAKAAQQIAQLQGQLEQEKIANAKFMDYLLAARAENVQIKEKYASEIGKLNHQHASQVAKLQEEHHKASTAHAEKVKAEHMAEIAKLQEQHHKASTAHAKKMKAEHMTEISKLQEEHHKASTAHAEKVKAKHMTEIAELEEKHAAVKAEHMNGIAKLQEKHADEVAINWLMKEHAVDVACVKHVADEEAADMVLDAKKDIALTLFPDLDTSLL